jgi:hypothetical protein
MSCNATEIARTTQDRRAYFVSTVVFAILAQDSLLCEQAICRNIVHCNKDRGVIERAVSRRVRHMTKHQKRRDCADAAESRAALRLVLP